MSSESGSRFTSNNSQQQKSYYNPPPTPEMQNNLTQNSPQNPSNTNYPLSNFSKKQIQQLPTEDPQATANRVQYLLTMFGEDQKIKIKAQNAEKYQMNPDSFIYRLPVKYLISLVFKYPQEFSPNMREQFIKTTGKMQRDYQIFDKIIWGVILYWAVLHRRAWFKLTGNPIMRLSCGLICINCMLDVTMDLNHYVAENAFIYNAQYEQVLLRHNINASTFKHAEFIV